MEHLMDVSWMTHGKDKLSDSGTAWQSSAPSSPNPTPSSQPLESSTPSKINGKATPLSSSPVPSPTPTPAPSQQPTTPARPILQRAGWSKNQQNDPSMASGAPPPPQRRGSWFSSLSSKFSGSPLNAQASPSIPAAESATDDIAPLPKITPNKNAVLQHGSRQTGDAPYIPAPPRSAQPGFLGVFRRLSSSSVAISPGSKAGHGLVERRVLNVDQHRERCRVDELCQAKLRRVAFCVDVEIAPMPKYADKESSCKKLADKVQKRKVAEKSEGLALKTSQATEEPTETADLPNADSQVLSNDPEKCSITIVNGSPKEEDTAQVDEPKPEKETSRRKEKKKKSEAERKAKKEQKRKEALEKGAIPMEIHLDSDSSTEDLSLPPGTPRVQSTPTTNPGRIYRRCCQLRETDILTKITLQLPKTTANCADGVVEKLDLTGYFLSLPDLVTLGDFLAVVPVREVILENCGLSDEGVRVVLAGLLAARKPNTKRRSHTHPADLTPQGGVVERLVLKNNKIGTEGWKHICLFIHMCRSIKYLDLSNLPFPAPAEQPKSPLSLHMHHFHGHNNTPAPVDMSLLLSKALGERLAGTELELISLGATKLNANQLGAVIDGVIKSGVSRIGLANNNLDAQGVQHVARYLHNAKCEGIDLGGNDLRDHMEAIVDAIDEKDQLWAMSLANCNLKPASLCKLFPKLAKLPNFKFLDLSHNHDLFESEPSAIGLLRRYLPKMGNLKRMHLADVSMSSEQAIALAEVLPEVKTLAHINILENTDLIRLADARTEDVQEEACALYASLLAAARVSSSLVKIDIDNPTTESGEVVKALANRALVYCMRNLQGVPDIRDSSSGEAGLQIEKYPEVLRHLVGHEEDYPLVEVDDGFEPAPDEDYVIGGTGVVKALTCVLKNRGDDSRRQSGEFTREFESGAVSPRTHLPPGKAKDMSKQLLYTARKIRVRLQPALAAAKASAKQDMNNYNRLLFLDQTIQGIIKRFEEEYPDTRQPVSPAATPPENPSPPVPALRTSSATLDSEPNCLSDTEDVETEVRSPTRSRSNSIISHTSRAFAAEEARVLRAGHKFRRSFITKEQFNILNSLEELGNDPSHVRMVTQLMDDLMEEDEQIRKKVEEKGQVKAFEEDREDIWRRLRDKDPQYWDRFLESQEKARANIKVSTNGTKCDAKCDAAAAAQESAIVDEEAVED